MPGLISILNLDRVAGCHSATTFLAFALHLLRCFIFNLHISSTGSIRLGAWAHIHLFLELLSACVFLSVLALLTGLVPSAPSQGNPGGRGRTRSVRTVRPKERDDRSLRAVIERRGERPMREMPVPVSPKRLTRLRSPRPRQQLQHQASKRMRLSQVAQAAAAAGGYRSWSMSWMSGRVPLKQTT